MIHLTIPALDAIATVHPDGEWGDFMGHDTYTVNGETYINSLDPED